jgi:hypothetical protein
MSRGNKAKTTTVKALMDVGVGLLLSFAVCASCDLFAVDLRPTPT